MDYHEALLAIRKSDTPSEIDSPDVEMKKRTIRKKKR
jgi:hypothetical protein